MSKPTSIFETRPDDVKLVHYACDGSIALINLVPRHFIRVGDTASGKDVDGERYFWKAIQGEVRDGVQGNIVWERGEAWDARLDADHVSACDLLCIVPMGSES